MPPLLSLEGIRKAYGPNQVLHDASLTLEAGEVHALVGANGAGKSTLIKVLAGATGRDGGDIRIDGRLCELRSPLSALREGIGVIYQEFHQAPDLTVAENMLLGAEPVRRRAGLPLMDRKRLFGEARTHLEHIGFDLDPAAPVRRLRTGEKQQLEIAKALYRQARILVLDEPTAALTRVEAARLFQLMGGLQQRGIGLIYISHHLDEVFEVADRISVLRDGRCVATWGSHEVTHSELVGAMLGREWSDAPARTEAVRGTALLQTSGLCGRGFRDVTLTVASGEIVALCGAAGAGQSELLWSLSGASPIQRGTFELGSRPQHFRNVPEAVRAGIVFCPGDRKSLGILGGLGVAQNLLFPYYRSLSRAGVLPPAKVRVQADMLIRQYGIRARSGDQPIDTLSGGNQQKVMVARAAERRARVYLFDEPTRGVDIGSREDLYRLIRRLAEGGAAVLIATPDIQEALRLGQRVIVFRQGAIVMDAENRGLDEETVLKAVLGAGFSDGTD